MKLGFGKDTKEMDENAGIRRALSEAMSGNSDGADASKNAEVYASKKAAKGASSKKASSDSAADVDLSKLKKKDLLEIMLRQGEEIDRLREQIADLEAQLADRNFKISKAGSLAEASLAVTKIFEEAEKAAMIYLENIRSKVQ